VTGGAGFIGSHLVDRLFKDGYEVIVIDNLSTGRAENIEKYFDAYKKVYFVNLNLSDCGHGINFVLLLDLIKRSDCIFHLAASVGVQNVLNNPIQCILNNNKSTETILELCANYNKRVIITSTSEVYGNSNHNSQIETDELIYTNPSNLRWSYAVSKLTDELLALSYYRDRGLKVTITRLFNTIGIRQLPDYGMVVPRFIQQALRGEDITVYGNGKQQRTFCSVYDVVDALIKLMDCNKAVGEIVNIGGLFKITIKNLAEIIIRLSESESKIKFVDYETAYKNKIEDMKSRQPWLEKANRLIGYKPKNNIMETLKEIIEYERSKM